MLERIRELNNKGYNTNEIADLLDIEPSVVDKVLREELFTLNESNIKKYYEIISIDQEMEILLKDLVEANISYSNKQNAVLIANETVTVRISKTGSIYFLLKGLYLKEPIRGKVLKLLVENQLKEIKELVELPRYVVKLMQSESGKEYICWFNKNGEPVMLMVKEAGLKRLENQLQSVEYKALKEELEYISHLEKEPIEREPDEIYGNKEPEVFIERIAELKEFLQVIMDMKNRKVSADEFDLLQTLQSEIGNIVG